MSHMKSQPENESDDHINAHDDSQQRHIDVATENLRHNGAEHNDVVEQTDANIPPADTAGHTSLAEADDESPEGDGNENHQRCQQAGIVAADES